MANKTLWAAESAATLLLAELNNAAGTATVVDAGTYNNATNKFRWADFLFSGIFDADCAAGDLVELHIFYRLDGTLYGDGEDGDGATPVASGNSLVGVFNIGVAGATVPVLQQVIGVPLSPFEFKAAVKLATTQALTAIDTHYVKMYPYNEELQG